MPMRGLKAAVAKVLKATWQRCWVHFMRNALAHASKGQRSMVAALLRTAFAQDSEMEARQQWRMVADQLRERFPGSPISWTTLWFDEKATRRWPMFHAAMSSRANAISTESPSWFNESRPDSGTSPDVL